MSGNSACPIDDRLLLKLASFRKRKLFTSNPFVYQEKVLLNLIKKSEHTLFGKTHDFISIRSSRDFFQHVAMNTYDDLNVGIDAIINGKRDILFPGKPVCFGITSGTYGRKKHIPLNRLLLRASRNAAMDAALLGGLRHGSMKWHRGKTLYIGPRKGRPMGKWTIYPEGTAFSYRQIKPLRARFVPEYRCLPEPDDTPDVLFLQRLIKRHRITAIAGNPVEIVDFLLSSGTVLPSVQIVFNCGYWAADHLHIYRTAFPNAGIVDVYGSNEGTWGLPVSLGEFLLNYQRVFFSFKPIDGENEITDLRLADLYRKYELCVTADGGFWNYSTGDVVCILSLKPPLVRLCGRKRQILSLAGEMLTEDEVIFAVRNSRIKSLKYYLVPDTKGYMLHLDGEAAEADTVDRNLCKINPTYGRLRAKGILHPLVIHQTTIDSTKHGKPLRITKGD